MGSVEGFALPEREGLGPDATESLPASRLMLLDENRLVRDAAQEAIMHIDKWRRANTGWPQRCCRAAFPVVSTYKP
jgi:hypothetical protein